MPEAGVIEVFGGIKLESICFCSESSQMQENFKDVSHLVNALRLLHSRLHGEGRMIA